MIDFEGWKNIGVKLPAEVQHLQGAEADGDDSSQLLGAYEDSASFVLHPWPGLQAQPCSKPQPMVFIWKRSWLLCGWGELQLYDDDAWGAEDEDAVYYEYDDAAWEDDGTYDEFDSEAVYYQENVADSVMDEDGYDPDEYDECFASFVDARRRFNELRMSRGFLPVVALDPNAGSTGAQQPINSKGKGKKGRGKGRGGKNNVKYSKAPMKPHDPKGRAQAAMRCLHCGSTSHTTSQCTQGSKPTPKAAPAGPNKRQATEGVASNNLADPENGMVMFEDQNGAQRAERAMMDPGASSFLMGYGPFCRYLDHLKKLNFPVHEITLKKANRNFHFLEVIITLTLQI